MKIVIVGGTGLIGSRLAALLKHPGLDVVSASPSSGVDTFTGRGLSEALDGAQVVIDVSNAPSTDQEAASAFFAASGRNLLAAAGQAGVEHHIALSIVGANRLPESGYFRAKMLQETLVRSAGIPFTIIRATPFFEYLDGIVGTGSDEEKVRVSPAGIQPIAADDVAAALRDIALGTPQGVVRDLAGPDRFRLTDIARAILTANEDPRSIVADATAPYWGAVLWEDSLLPEGCPSLAPTHFADWLRSYVAETLAPAV